MAFRFPQLSTSFSYLNVTQFLGAMNDNIFKLLIIYFFIEYEGIENSNTILAVTGAIFVLPFLLFSASSGILADRFSKSNIIMYTKVLEFVALALGVLALQYESKFAAFAVLFLMATLSAIFAPSKYGIIPELVKTDKITQANGLMSSFTFLAIIIGTFATSFFLDITGKHFIFVALMALGFAFIAMVASFCIEYTPPADATKRFNVLFISEIFRTLKIAAQKPSLLTAVFGSSFFLFLGAFVQLNMIPFAVHSLHLTDVQGGYLFLLTALGIGSGSIFAGKISGKYPELGLVPLAAAGVAVCCFLLEYFSDNVYAVIPLVMLLGMLGGMYQVPLDAHVQTSSPNESRGQIVAATNFMSFFGVLCASGFLYLLSEVLHLSPDRGFTFMGIFTIFVTMIMGYQFFDYISRFIGMLLSRVHFNVSLHGTELIPRDMPAIYICRHTAWNDTLLILGSQRRRMRFFIEKEHPHEKPWIQWLYHLLWVVQLSPIEPFKHNSKSFNAFKTSLKKGISVCIFVDNDDLSSEIQQLKRSAAFQEAFDVACPIVIPVVIEKGEKQVLSSWKFLNKYRIPASVSFGN